MNVFKNLIPKEYATMAESTTQSLAFPESNTKDVMTEILRQGAQRMLAQAIQEEVDEWIDGRAELRDAAGRHQVVRNGYLPGRTTYRIALITQRRQIGFRPRRRYRGNNCRITCHCRFVKSLA